MTLSNMTMFPTPRTVAESRTTLDHTVGAPHPPTIYQLLSITKLRFIILITFFDAWSTKVCRYVHSAFSVQFVFHFGYTSSNLNLSENKNTEVKQIITVSNQFQASSLTMPFWLAWDCATVKYCLSHYQWSVSVTFSFHLNEFSDGGKELLAHL